MERQHSAVRMNLCFFLLERRCSALGSELFLFDFSRICIVWSQRAG